MIDKFIFPKTTIFDRKEKLELENTLIISPTNSGKTYLILNFLKNFDEEEILYIDFEDYRKHKFSLENKKIAVFENYDFSIPILEIPTLVTSKKNIEIDNFKKIILKNLDFEEYFSFSKHSSIKLAFNQFFQDGNSPYLLFLEEFFKVKSLREKIESMPYNQTILKFLFSHIGEKFSLYQIYTILKKNHKISKDLLYSQVKEILKDKVMFFVDKLNSPNSPKKIFSYDFGYKSVLTTDKNILNILENMVFLELREECFYVEFVNFYLPKTQKAILVIPFVSLEQIENRLKQIPKKLDIKKIEIVTISNEFTYKYQNIFVDAKPFWMWALME